MKQRHDECAEHPSGEQTARHSGFLGWGGARTAAELIENLSAGRGVLACALIDAWSGTVALEGRATSARRVDLAAASLARAARASQRGQLCEVLITVRDEYHWAFPLPGGRTLAYAVLDRHSSNLALLRQLVNELCVAHQQTG
jgi:hypothetical protein